MALVKPVTPAVRALSAFAHQIIDRCLRHRFQSPIVMADADPKAAAEQRLRIFKMAVDRHCWIAGGHLYFPGIGHVRAAQDRFFWIPVNYTIPH